MKKQILLLITVLTISKLTLAFTCYNDADCQQFAIKTRAYCMRGLCYYRS